MGRSKTWSVTEIVAAEYCEQKVLHDQRYGNRPTREAQRAMRDGQRDHDRFERDGLAQQAGQDSRCYIATAVFGGDAIETNELRDWRDNWLSLHSAGRAFIQAYYWASPTLVKLFAHIPGANSVIRTILRGFLRLLGGRNHAA